MASFFTVSALLMIAVRLLAGRFMDRMDKTRALRIFILLLIPCYLLFGRMDSPGTLGIMAACYGLCIGFLMPLLNAALFLASPPTLRGLNTNLALFAMDAGFFLSPYAGGAFLAAGGSFDLLFALCAAVLSMAFLLLIPLKPYGTKTSGKAAAGADPPT
ncbi:MAG TPA: MFS transporter [Syntrophobacteraceae bacterium]|nr:MFS transporter [Syntrophobacteraceae bacterium]